MARMPGTGEPRRVFGAALAATIATYGLQLHTVPALKTAAREAGFGGGRRPGAEDLIHLAGSSLGALDGLVVALLVVGLVWLAVLELRGRCVTQALRAGLSGDGDPLPLLVIVGALAVRSYFDPGLPHGFDAKQHMAKVFAVHDALRDGAWPAWSWRWYGGFPLLRFYGPLSYLVSGVLGLLAGGAVAGVKAYLLLAHVVSAVATYRFVRSATDSRAAATLATIVVLLSFQRTHTLLGLGRLPEAALWALLPTLLALVEAFVRDGRSAHALCAGTTLAAMVLTHPVLGAVGGVLAGAWAAVRLLATGRLRARPVATVVFALSTGTIAVLLALFWLAPATAQRQFVQIDHLYGAGAPALFPTRFDPKDLLEFLRWGHPARAASPVAYAGWSVVLLAAVGAWRHARARTALVVPALLMVLAGLAYASGGYFLGRAGAYLTPFLALLVGLAVVPAPASGAPRRACLAVGLVLIDLLPLTVSAPFRPDLAPVERDLARLAQRLGAARAVVASSRSGKIEVAQWTGWDGSGLAVLGGPFREGATALYPFEMAALRRVGDDLADGGPLSEGTLRALRLLGVGAIAVDDGAGLATPDVRPGPGYRVVDDPPAVLIDGTAPLLIAATAAPLAPGAAEAVKRLADRRLTDLPSGDDRACAEAALDALIAACDGDAAWPSRLPGRSYTAAPGRAGADTAVSVRTLEASRRLVRLEIETGAPAMAWLPFADFPGVSVRLDGELVERAPAADALPITCIAVPAGRHELLLAGPAGPGSGVLGWISFATLLAVSLLWWRTRARPGVPRTTSSGL